MKDFLGLIAGPIVGVILALIVWGVSMFVWGDYFWFMQGVGPNDYESAAPTRLVMAIFFFIGTIVTWCIIGAASEQEQETPQN